jgi:hypothetical protein
MGYCATCFDTSLHLILWIIWQQKCWYLGILLLVVFYDFLRFNVRSDVNLNLSLNPHCEQVFLRGYPGFKIDYTKERCLHMVGRLQPTVVLLQVGWNVLCQLDKSVQEIEQKLIVLILNITILLSCTKSGSFADFTSAMA